MNELLEHQLLQQTEEDNLACIDGENSQVTASIREYLLAHGCTVLENYKKNIDCLYYFVVGGTEFVKEMFSRNLKSAQRTIAIIQTTDLKFAEDFANRFHTKVVLVPAGNITSDQARVVFGFLFTETDHILSLHPAEISPVLTNEIEEKKITPKEKPLDEVTTKQEEKNHLTNWEEDSKRIKELLKKSMTKPNKKRSMSFRFVQYFFGYITATICIWICLHFLAIISSTILLTQSFSGKIPLSYSLWGTSLLEIAGLTVSPIPKHSIPFLSQYKVIVEDISEIAAKSRPLLQKSLKLNSDLFFSSDSSGSSTLATLTDISKDWKSLEPSLSTLEADTKNTDNYIPKIFQPLWIKGKQKLHDLRDTGHTLDQFTNLYPLMGGYPEEQRYMILFQNSAELRPTGGFIGTVGFLSIKEGKITSLSFEDVYTIDGQLRGHVDPPLPIRTMLAQEHWYLRDSNWDPDFEESALKAKWFLEKSTGQIVDGVIAVNISFAQKLLRIVGPISIDGVEEKITADNLFGILNKEIHENFFPGSTKKKNIISSLNTVLLEKIKTDKSYQFAFAKAFAQSVRDQDIQIFSTETKTEDYIKTQGWGGELLLPSTCPKTELQCVDDFLAIVEANLGVNKSNYYVSRSFKRTLLQEDRQLVGDDEITIINNAENDQLAGGDYTSYTRLYYPEDTTITSITINNQEITPTEATMSAKPLPYTETIEEKEHLHTVGIAFSVKPKTNTTIVVKFTNPIVTPIKNYHFTLRKQPGTVSLPIDLSFSGGDTIPKLEGDDDENASFVAKSGFFKYNTSIDTNKRVSIYFYE